MTIKINIWPMLLNKKLLALLNCLLMEIPIILWDLLLILPKLHQLVVLLMARSFSHQELMIYVSICGKLIFRFLLKAFIKSLKITLFPNYLKVGMKVKWWVTLKISSITVKFDQKMSTLLKQENLMEKYLWVQLQTWWEVWVSIRLKRKYRICKMKSDIVNMLIIIKKLWANCNFKLS